MSDEAKPELNSQQQECLCGKKNCLHLRVVTVRMERVLHDRLREAAYRSRTSMNKLCAEALSKEADALLDQLAEPTTNQ